jgi:hypothetical protein
MDLVCYIVGSQIFQKFRRRDIIEWLLFLSLLLDQTHHWNIIDAPPVCLFIVFVINQFITIVIALCQKLLCSFHFSSLLAFVGFTNEILQRKDESNSANVVALFKLM